MSFHFNLSGFPSRPDQQRSRTEFYSTRIGANGSVTNNLSFSFYSEHNIFFCQTTHITAIICHFGNYHNEIRTVRYQIYFLSICIQTKFGRPTGRHFLLCTHHFSVNDTFGNHIYFLPVLLCIAISACFPKIPYIFEYNRCIRHMPFGMNYRLSP